MSEAARSEDFRDVWIANAHALDAKGHFCGYPRQRREEVLRKGYLGNWRPDEALRVAKRELEGGRAFRTPKLVNELRDGFGITHEGATRALLAILEEVPPASYVPPVELKIPPGHPFIFDCRLLGKRVYFKIQVEGSRHKPSVRFCSCHMPDFGN